MNVALPVCLWGGWSETFYKCVYNISMPISTAQMHRQALGKEDIGQRPAGDAGGLSLRQKQGGGFSTLRLPTAPSHSRGLGLSSGPGQCFQMSSCLPWPCQYSPAPLPTETPRRSLDPITFSILLIGDKCDRSVSKGPVFPSQLQGTSRHFSPE